MKNGRAGETTSLDRTREGYFEIIEMSTAEDCRKLLLSALQPRQSSVILMPSQSSSADVNSIHKLKLNKPARIDYTHLCGDLRIVGVPRVIGDTSSRNEKPGLHFPFRL